MVIELISIHQRSEERVSGFKRLDEDEHKHDALRLLSEEKVHGLFSLLFNSDAETKRESVELTAHVSSACEVFQKD